MGLSENGGPYWVGTTPLLSKSGTRPGKRLRNELEHHHAMKMGKSTIFDGAIFYVANCKRLPEGKTCKWDNPS